MLPKVTPHSRLAFGKSRKREIRIATVRFGYFVRIIVKNECLSLCLSNSFFFFYLSCALSRDICLAGRKALERKKGRERRRTQARRQRRPSIKTLKITEFLLVFRELYQRAREQSVQARVLPGICRRRKFEFADINPPFLLLGMLSCNHAS